MKTHNRSIAQRNMLMSVELIKVMKLLEENNIEAIPFKGPLLAQMAYGDITLRQYVDLDILINEHKLDKAIQLLSKHNYVYNQKEYQQIMKNKSIFHDISLSKNSVSIELHWRLFSDEFKTNFESIKIDKNLFEVTIANYKLKSFQNEILIIYLAIHGTKHNWERVEWLLDIVKIIQNHSVDWQQIIELMHTTKTKKILLSTFYLCHTVLDLNLPYEIQTLVHNPKSLKLSKSLEELFYQNFKSRITQKVATKNISKIQYLLLDGFRNKSLFILSLFTPTELEFKTIQLPQSMRFLYYIIRPVNVLLRWIKKI